MSQLFTSGTGGGGGSNVLTLTGNSGGAVSPSAGNINVVGDTTSITIAGNPGTSTLTASITGTTNHSLQLGNASGTLSNLGVATNGQLPIGSTGANPVLATLSAGTGIVITNGAGSIQIAATGTTNLNYTSVNHAASPYTVLATDEYISVDCSAGVVSLLFPNAATSGRAYVVKDRTGNAQTNNITITTVGGAVNIDGVTSYVMNTQYSAVNIMGNNVSYEIY